MKYAGLEANVRAELESTAQALVAPGKGILAADESSPTIKKRFDSIGVESTEENRRSYRELLFTAPGIQEAISGVIMFDESLRQSTVDGIPFAQVLAERGIIPGIKVDKGTLAIAGTAGEKVTQGLDGLGERLAEYKQLGARFAKWRAVITIAEQIPSPLCLALNAHALARYAALCQAAGIVPIVEPEVLMTGSHDIERCEEATTRTLHQVFTELYKQGVYLEGMLLKPNMVISGLDCPRQGDAEAVAQATLRCFRRVVPAAVPGLVFLSGGQSPEVATLNLNAMNALGPAPWELSFSYGRALQETTLKAWLGQPANVGQAQAMLLHRAKCNGAARFGTYTKAMENH
jgi:fructose-bisphosphate aldolase class I